MARTIIAATLIALTVVCGACSTDSEPASDGTTTAAQATTTRSPWHTSEVVADLQRTYTGTIVDTVRQSGGSDELVLAALVASRAETGWVSPKSINSGEILDIYGWRYRYGQFSAESPQAVAAATTTFVEAAAAVPADPDPAGYALAIQHAHTATFHQQEHAAAPAYQAAVGDARSVFVELTGEEPPS